MRFLRNNPQEIKVHVLRRVLFLSLIGLFFLTADGDQQEARDMYKTGMITLKNTPGFGEETDWDTLFYHKNTDITVAPDGSIFAASSRQHKVFKFDSNGNLIKAFGQKGQGPGDFNHPGDLSILDKKYLVVGEYALSHRISLFDLEGHFVKVLKTTKSVYSPLALGDGKVAYMSLSHGAEDKNQTEQFQTVYIKDTATQKEIEVSSFNTVLRAIRLKSGTRFHFDESAQGRTLISRTKDGNLVVGISNQPFLTVYSPDGEKLYEISLRGEAVPVTRSVIRRFKEEQLNDLREDPQFMKGPGVAMVKELEKADFGTAFDEHLPLYRELLADEAGHILVFRKDGCFFDCPNTFEVYTSEGDFICETEIKTGDYKLSINSRQKHMCFTEEGLIALVEPKDSPKYRLEIIKAAY